MNGHYKRILPAVIFIFSVLVAPLYASAQQNPPLPAPLKNMADEGAQMRYLGQQNGLDGWIAIKGGKEQYFYVTADGQAFVMGLLFDKTGKITTLKQVQALQESGEGETLDFFAREGASSGMDAITPQDRTDREFKTPSEQLFSDVESSNWIMLGNKDAPYIYVFIDPQCPYCHSFLNDLRTDYIDKALFLQRLPDESGQTAFIFDITGNSGRIFGFFT